MQKFSSLIYFFNGVVMHHTLKGTLISALFSVSVTSQAAVFSSYNEEGSFFRSHLNSALSENLITQFKDKADSKDGVLYLLEQARLLQVNHQYEESRDYYKQAFTLLEKQKNRAKISVSRMGFKALAMVSNDSVVPYLVPAHEQVLAHISQAKNYIFLKDLEAAAVEMRVAQGLQREIELLHQKELEKKKDKVAKNTEAEKNLSVLDEAFVGLDPIAGKIKNSYQNAYAFYMAANLWETLGEYNDALVDYKKAYELQPDKQISEDVKRLDQLVTQHKKGSVPVIVFIEQGIVPQKVENKIDVPTPGGLINIAFATYEPSTYVIPTSLKVKVNNKALQDSYVISDIGALAVKDLKEKIMANVSSQVLRATAKYAAQKELGNQFGVFGQLAGNVLNMATERADLRGWSTLPSNAQIARLNLTPGKHNLQLSSGSVSSSPVTLDVKANQTVFVYAHHVNDKITASVSTIPH